MSERPGEAEGAAGAPDAAPAHGAHLRAHSHSHPQARAHEDRAAPCCRDNGAPAPPKPHDTNALISARRLGIVRSGRTILSDVDLDIRSGEIVTLIGPNGAGKTTLVRTLLGLERPDDGTVRRRRGLVIGYVPQRFDIDPALPMTVSRFLALGEKTRRSRIASALAEVGAAKVADQQLSELSGGELQRVLLARALLNDPDLLVLDEPAGGVDYVGEAELYMLIGQLRDARGLGVLLISHDLHVVMGKSDRVICLNRHVCCSGIPEAVAKHPEYVRLFGHDEARAFAVYQHRHDHRHDLAGDPAPVSREKGEDGSPGDAA